MLSSGATLKADRSDETEVRERMKVQLWNLHQQEVRIATSQGVDVSTMVSYDVPRRINS